MTDDMTPAQARRALSGLLDSYDGRKIWTVVTGQGINEKLAGPDDRNALEAITDTLDQSEIRRKTVGDADDADPRGVEETPQGTAAMQDEAMTISWPVEFAVEVIGEPGRRSVELSSESRIVNSLDDVRGALASNYPSERKQDDPVNEFLGDLADTVASRLGGDLDSADTVGEVGTLRLRSDGRWTFHQTDGDDTLPEGAVTPTRADDSGGGFAGSTERTTRPGDTQPTSQRPERNQQTLAEAGTVEGLGEFAEGTVEDDPDRVIGAADEVREAERAPETGGEFTEDRRTGLGRFEQFDATIKVAIQKDPDKENALGETIPGTETIMPYLVPPDGRTINMELKTDLEDRLYRAGNVSLLINAHGANTTVTVGSATFTDGGDTFGGFDLNGNWYGEKDV